MKSARELIVYSSVRHFFECRGKDVAYLFIAPAYVLIDEEIKGGGMGEFRSATKSTILRVEHPHRRFHDGVNNRRRKIRAFPGKRFRVRNRALDHLRLLHDVVILFVISVRDGKQYALETRTAVVVVWREIRTAV